MQNYNFVKNDVFVAKMCKYALYESSEGLFCAPRKAANFCHPDCYTSWFSATPASGCYSKVHYVTVLLE